MGQLLGKQIQPRALAAFAYAAGITDAHELVVAVAVSLSESQGYSEAFNDNVRPLSHTDVKVGAVVLNAETMQPFTVVSKTATSVVLRDEDGHQEPYPPEALVIVSRDVGCWQINIPAAQIMTEAEVVLHDPETNADRMFALYSARKWQPWVAFNTGVYLHDSYLRRASLGVMNHLAETLVLRARAAGQAPQTRIPMITAGQLAKLYP